jgi:DNA-binding MarR family transcriptional regulator
MPAGKELVDKAVKGHLANEMRLLEALDEDERARMVELLRTLLLSLGDTLDE